MDDPDEVRTFALRISDRASSDIDDAYEWIERTEGLFLAEQWRQGLFSAIASLSRSPIRPLVREQEFFRIPVRFITYRRTSYSAAYRVLFTVVENTADAPFVELLAVRHGAQDVVTLDEARQIEEGQ